MAYTNTDSRFGAAARIMHWLTALLILSAIALGLIANGMAFDTGTALARKAQFFSLHKTIGIAAFFVALARVLWAFTQRRPTPLHPDRILENRLAEIVHWLLYISMLAVPLSGWIHHAAVTGFAPILWPFGQGLPFVPKSETVAAAATWAHAIFGKVLIVSVLLHIAGALKHAIIDRDGTLSRMMHGTEVAAPRHRRPVWPAAVALALYAAGTVLALTLAQNDAEALQTTAETTPAAITAPSTPPAQTPAATANVWTVTGGSLGFGVKQMGSMIDGSFGAWTAEIDFAETPVGGEYGKARVRIDTTTLTLGSVTDQARGTDFFDTATHPDAVFEATILPGANGKGYLAKGTLTLRGVAMPVDLPFTLDIQGDTATMTGSTTLDRRDFGMGATYQDESTVGFAVTVKVDLTARRG